MAGRRRRLLGLVRTGVGIHSAAARDLFPSSDGCHTLSCVLIFDASTLILLAKAELLDLFLDDFPDTPLVPGAVEAEATHDLSRPDGILIRERIREGRLTIEEVRQSKVPPRLLQHFRLGLGEAEALALALEKEEDGVVIATDDRNAIRACKVLRIGFVTSLGASHGESSEDR
jgi:predicted nucleic acid-binding protein